MSSPQTLAGATVVLPDGVLPGGTVVVDGTHIRTVASAATAGPPPAGAVDLAGRFLVPGFIDVHVHGGGGFTFDEGAASLTGGVATHLAAGTTRLLVSLVTAPLEAMAAAVSTAAALDLPSVLGLHLEGPFLSEHRRGVHRTDFLQLPSRAAMDTLLSAGAGRVRVVTLAPELPGGVDLVRHLDSSGVIAAIGHSDAEYAQGRAAFDAGARLVTHAFNGMRGVHHRDPGIVGAALDAGAHLELINDGVHVHPTVGRLLACSARDRLVLVSDSMAAAGQGDGRYSLAGQEVSVVNGVARLVVGDSIAGSTLTMALAFRNAVRQLGADLSTAANLTSRHPAQLLGVDGEFGSIRAGAVADLVVLDPDLRVERVMLAGRWLDRDQPIST